MGNSNAADAFTYDGGRVEPGDTQHVRYTVTETYLGDPVRIPVSIINGANPGPTLFLSAAIHGDELNGIEVVREVAHNWDHDDLHGTLVCLPVVNVPGFLAQERYLPIQDRDLNRAFPGKQGSTSAKRIAYRLFQNFIEPCDFGIDFHTSTRGRTNMLHARADMATAGAARLAKAFGATVILDSAGPSGTLRREATAQDVPTITIEMGQAHRFQRNFIERGLTGVRRVCDALGLYPTSAVDRPEWQFVVDTTEKTWLRADAGGLVDMHYDRGDIIREGETICTITNPFKTATVTVDAPYTGLLIGVLENPVVSPGNPLCHFVELPSEARQTVRTLQSDWVPDVGAIGATGE